MAKSVLRIKARKLRQQGFGVKEIARTISIPQSTVSKWVRDIILTLEQWEQLQKRSLKGAEKGRLLGAFSQKRRRLAKIEKYINDGKSKLATLNEREFLIAGLAIYWGEGSKKKRRVEFCNSDPEMVKFVTRWLKLCFNVLKEDLICWVGINEAHMDREIEVRKYWSELMEIPLERFRKTSYKRVKSQKVYENFNQHFGTLYITVAKSSELFYKINGLINGLINGSVAQWESERLITARSQVRSLSLLQQSLSRS